MPNQKGLVSEYSLVQGIRLMSDSKSQSTFINNTGSKVLKDRISKLIGFSKELKFLVGFFNTDFFKYTYSHYYAGGGLGNKGVRYKGEFMQNYPIPRITPENQHIIKQIEKIVEQILSTKKQGPNADTSSAERQIDQMVYELYGLTPEEIAVVEGISGK